MWNLQDDNDLDKLSRDAAENYSIDRSPDSWNKLHLRLDAEMPTHRRRRYIIFFLLFVFVGSGVFWLTRMNADDRHSPEIATTVGSSEKAASSPDNRKTNENIQPSGAPSATNSGSATQAEVETSVQPNLEQTAPTSNDLKGKTTDPTRQGPPDKSATSIIRKQTGNAPGKKVNKPTPVTKAPIAVIENNAITDQDISSNPQKVVERKDESKTTNQIDEENRLIESSKGNEVNNEPAKSTDISAPKKAAVRSNDNSKWTFGAVYAPDISSVKFTHSQPAGYNVGLTVEYKLSDKFSLQSGLIYTRKKYKMNGEDYHPPKGTWFDYIHLVDVTGNCEMFDIPLNVRFNAIRKKSSNFFVTAGLSTYLMKEENYSYYYYYNSNPTTPTTRDRSYDTDSEYLFSILNISVGYEKKLSKAFSLQVEPFFKQPLTGLGFGEMKLNSAGVYFSLRYNPLKPAKKGIAVKK